MDVSLALLDPEQRRIAARRHALGLVLAPLLALCALWLAPDNMSPRAARLMALLAATLVLWMTEALPVGMTALAAAAVAVLAGVADTETVFAPFSHPTVWLLLAAFLVGAAAQWRQLDRVFVVRFFSLGRTRLVDLATTIAVASFALSTWLPNRVVVSLMARVVQEQEARFGPRFQRLGLSSVALASALGGLVTPIGAPANLIALAALAQYDDRDVPLLFWTLAAAPLATLLLAAWLVAVRLVLGLDGEQIVHGDLRLEPLSQAAKRPRPPTTQMLRLSELPALAFGLDRGQMAIAAVGATTLLLWAIPGLARLLPLDDDVVLGLSQALPAAPVALVLAAVLFILPAARRNDSASQGEPVASWEVASKIDWDVLLLVGSALALGHQTIDTGLSHWLGDLATRGLRVEGVVGLTLLMTWITLIVTQLTSGTVAAAICAPLAVVSAQQIGVSPVPACLAAGMAASFGLLLPMSDECNQIIWATHSFRRNQLIRRGLVGILGAAIGIPPVCLLAARVLGL